MLRNYTNGLFGSPDSFILGHGQDFIHPTTCVYRLTPRRERSVLSLVTSLSRNPCLACPAFLLCHLSGFISGPLGIRTLNGDWLPAWLRARCLQPFGQRPKLALCFIDTSIDFTPRLYLICFLVSVQIN